MLEIIQRLNMKQKLPHSREWLDNKAPIAIFARPREK